MSRSRVAAVAMVVRVEEDVDGLISIVTWFRRYRVSTMCKDVPRDNRKPFLAILWLEGEPYPDSFKIIWSLDAEVQEILPHPTAGQIRDALHSVKGSVDLISKFATTQ